MSESKDLLDHIAQQKRLRRLYKLMHLGVRHLAMCERLAIHGGVDGHSRPGNGQHCTLRWIEVESHVVSEAVAKNAPEREPGLRLKFVDLARGVAVGLRQREQLRQSRPVCEHIQVLACDLHGLLIVHEALHLREEVKLRSHGVVNGIERARGVRIAPEDKSGIRQLNPVEGCSILADERGRGIHVV